MQADRVIKPSPSTRSPGKSSRKGGRARTVLERPAAPLGWDTSDEHEIELRRWRGRTEITTVEAMEMEHPFFGTFRTRSESGTVYEVEIRSLDGLENGCGCIDHRVNGLGTCKHIEGVLAGLRRRGVRAFRQAVAKGSGRVEVFLRRTGAPTPVVTCPRVGGGESSMVRAWLSPWLTPGGQLSLEPGDIESLLAAYADAPPPVRDLLRLSRHFGPWLDRHRRERSRLEARAAFATEVERDPAVLDMLRHPLLPYQREGMAHLAFGERALLADEMGLGKTVQAIAACELLARRKGVERVLVVCPASLKAEWEEQIARFTERPTRSVFGPRPARLLAYRDPPFFTIVNYEQVVSDAEAINDLLTPDIVVLDEAQRIKNWRTKTASKVKSLRSPYAFVLTGTPVENRIDELYSIIQYLDPELVGPLFQFNRSFYELDERGRPVEYRNLAELRRRVAPVLLRRRKSDVETELPGRTVTNYFVPMAPEQADRYEEYRTPLARLAAIAQRRPLSPAEFDKMQMLMACMRMICDTPAILDPDCRVCPKLEELEGILGDLLQEPDRKIIIFSEWERMLGLVRELAGELGVEAAWHTGSVPQVRRREEINRFKNDPNCRLFLSTDSGSVGLNLQAASAVINIDLPWNPAKLEQRIARAWRKHQTRPVAVINLVTEGSIEHAILHLLNVKQVLADGLLDGHGDIGALKMPSGRGALVDRMRSMLEAADGLGPKIVSPEDALAVDLRLRHGERALRIEVQTGPGGARRVLAVLDLDADGLAGETERLSRRQDAASLPVEVLDRATWLTLRRLARSGVLDLTGGGRRILHVSPEFGEPDAANNATEHDDAWREEAERAIRMARVLAAGGFPEEAPPLLAKALRYAVAARLRAAGEAAAPSSTIAEQVLDLLKQSGLSVEAEQVLAILRPGAAAPTPAEAAELARLTMRLVAALATDHAPEPAVARAALTA
ncbi:MAG: DEAD/DEAH box helicase [Caulobacterales bacterium]|nr:DEAD/DEAH box helicase [Caulobacterales bacterium]